MKDYFEYYFIEPFEDGDYGIGIITWLLSLIALISVVTATVYATDSAFLNNEKVEGTIVGKKYRAAYTYFQYTQSVNSTIMMPVNVPESFSVKININGLYDYININQSAYNDLVINEKVDCIYHKGRVFNTIYIESFSYE